MQALLDEGYDAVFVGTGAPRGRDLDIPGRKDAARHISIGIAWLASVAFGHTERIGERVLVIGGGNTAMDCCRTARRLGGRDVKVVVRSGFDEMKASPWEKEDAMREGIPIINNHVPKAFVVDNGTLQGMQFEKVDRIKGANGRLIAVPTGEDPVFLPCDHVLLAIGQENSFPWIERDIDIDFKGALPVVDPLTLQSTHPRVFFGGDAALGPKNIIWAVAHGHEAAISIDLSCRGEDVSRRPARGVNLVSQKMGMHEWSYDNEHSPARRFPVPHADKFKTLKNIKIEVELGFDEALAYQEAERCLNCDIQTVFNAKLCIECDACVDICPMDCITFTKNGPEEDIRTRLRASSDNIDQALYVSDPLTTGRIMVKDEDVCVHCSLCAERCPTGAWDMQKSLIHIPQAGTHARSCPP